MIEKLAIATAATGAALFAAPAAHAGVLDGVLNNAHVIDDISSLSSIINSDSTSEENSNANTAGGHHVTNLGSLD
ncbi:hypothetical protein ACRAKI_09740 [Saccharothrix isguenensis]